MLGANEMQDQSKIRQLNRTEAKGLKPGAANYTAYVGPPDRFDLMAASQFRLLTTLGLREHHLVLDFGCGSLRAGMLLIPYLLPGRYYGLDPNKWLIEDAIKYELGNEIIDLKRPVFRHETDFRADGFGVTFDFILAQSIFSHAGRDIIMRALTSFRECLSSNGIAAITFAPPLNSGNLEFDGQGWVYPALTMYRIETVLRTIGDAGLYGRKIPWFHPRQIWFIVAKSPDQLPPADEDVHLSGMTVQRSAG
jgi:SAM-dependent methyltransferase